MNPAWANTKSLCELIIRNSMDPKRRRIYIIIIVVCILGAGGVWLWSGSIGNSGSSGANLSNLSPSPLEPAPRPTTPPPTTVGPITSFSAPAVFPANTKLDTSILHTNTVFQTLRAAPALSLDPKELGRDDPFKPY